MKRTFGRIWILFGVSILVIGQMGNAAVAQELKPDDLPGPEPVPLVAPGLRAVIGGIGGALRFPALPPPRPGGEDAAKEVDAIRRELSLELSQPNLTDLNAIEERVELLIEDYDYQFPEAEELLALIDRIRSER